MTAVYAITDPEWFNNVRKLPKNRTLAFWQPTAGKPKDIKIGERWYFQERTKSLIRGFGLFEGWEKLTLSELFDKYSDATGCETSGTLLAQIQQFKHDATSETIVGNVILSNFHEFDLTINKNTYNLKGPYGKLSYLTQGDPMAGLGPQEAVSNITKGENSSGISTINDMDDNNLNNDIASALEGENQQRRNNVLKRAKGLIDKFTKYRAQNETLYCDDCGFNPLEHNNLIDIKPRSCLDVHHKNPLAEVEGVRKTTFQDLALLCPTCHRIEHLRMGRDTNTSNLNHLTIK